MSCTVSYHLPLRQVQYYHLPTQCYCAADYCTYALAVKAWRANPNMVPTRDSYVAGYSGRKIATNQKRLSSSAEFFPTLVGGGDLSVTNFAMDRRGEAAVDEASDTLLHARNFPQCISLHTMLYYEVTTGLLQYLSCGGGWVVHVGMNFRFHHPRYPPTGICDRVFAFRMGRYNHNYYVFQWTGSNMQKVAVLPPDWCDRSVSVPSLAHGSDAHGKSISTRKKSPRLQGYASWAIETSDLLQFIEMCRKGYLHCENTYSEYPLKMVLLRYQHKHVADSTGRPWTCALKVYSSARVSRVNLRGKRDEKKQCELTLKGVGTTDPAYQNPRIQTARSSSHDGRITYHCLAESLDAVAYAIHSRGIQSAGQVKLPTDKALFGWNTRRSTAHLNAINDDAVT